MVSTLKRQLSDEEKKIILGRFGRCCFANGHTIPDTEQVQFDHIKAHSLGGDSDLNNIAPMCAQHNMEKGQLSLGDFRIKLQLDEFFSKYNKPTLRHLLSDMQGRGEVKAYARPVNVTVEADSVTVEMDDSNSLVHNSYSCPTTGWKYFYATIPVSIIDSDDDEDESIGLQPRYLIKDKVFSLYRHFQRHPVLQPSIGRVSNNRIKIFDGQHKIAALLLNKRNSFECKIYLSPSLRLLNNTNIAAHDAFAQTRFYSSIMVLKLGAEFARDFEDFKASDSYVLKSEKNFLEYVSARHGSTLTKADLNNRFRSHLYSSILESKDNRLEPYVSKQNRGTDATPITLDMLQKSIFKYFIYKEPTMESMTSDSYHRDDEVRNVVELCNMLVDNGMHAWNADAPPNDATRRRLSRIFSSKSMMAWSELLWDAVSARLELYDMDERMRVFYRPLTSDQLERVKITVIRLCAWQRWDAPKDDVIDRVLAGNKSVVKEWFKNNGLTTGYLMGASV